MAISEGLQDQLKAAAILGAFAWVFNGIGDLKHGQDQMAKDVHFHTGQLTDLWSKWNEKEVDDKDELQRIKRLETIHELDCK